MIDFDIQKVKKSLTLDIQKIRDARIAFEKKTQEILKSIDADAASAADPDVLFPDDKEDAEIAQSLENLDENLNTALLKLAKKNDKDKVTNE